MSYSLATEELSDTLERLERAIEKAKQAQAEVSKRLKELKKALETAGFNI